MEASPGLLQIVVLAIIQGVTEFLPISSSAHLILPAQLADWPDQGLAFDVAVHLGTLAAAMIYFRRDLFAFGRSGLVLCTERRWSAELDSLTRIGIATLPIVAAGGLFADQIETHLRNTTVIAITTIVFGLALWWADWANAERTSQAATPTLWQALLIGCAQALALIPGTSRAGITIAAALALGLGRVAALRFSFLLAIPTIAAASLLMAVAAEDDLPAFAFAAGFVVAGLCAWVCIGAFMRLVERIGMMPFAIYRLVLGAVLLLFF